MFLGLDKIDLAVIITGTRHRILLLLMQYRFWAAREGVHRLLRLGRRRIGNISSRARHVIELPAGGRGRSAVVEPLSLLEHRRRRSGLLRRNRRIDRFVSTWTWREFSLPLLQGTAHECRTLWQVFLYDSLAVGSRTWRPVRGLYR